MKNVIVIILFPFLMDGVFGAEEIKEVTEGDSLTLPTGLTETQSSGRILWLYGSDKTILAKIDEGTYITNVDDERFKGNLELDKQTGSLIIKNNRIKNSGLYELDIGGGTTSKKFSVRVYASLPTPDIDSPQCAQTTEGSSSPICVFQCSVQTSDQTTLSWYRGNSVVSSKISDICSSISLRLEVNYEDKNIYSCMVNNPISNKTKHLDIALFCKPCEDPGLSPGAVVGIVIVVLLLVFAAVATGVIYYQHDTISELQKLILWERESVTLPSDTKIKSDDQILWTFGDEDTPIAEIKRGTEEIITYDNADGRFRDRLELDKETGSLTITETRADHTGLYKLKIISGGRTSYKRFHISVKVEETISKTERESVTLNPHTEIQNDHLILWMFKDQNQTLIAEIKRETGEMFTYDYAADERFRDRLKLDKKTGSLTITNTRTTDSGVYQLQIKSNGGISYKTFRVTVSDKVEMKLLEGEDSVTLQPDAKIQREDLFLWTFGAEDTLIAQIRGGTEEIIKYDDNADGRFRDRLKLNEKTGSLTITNITDEHTGVYKLQTIGNRETSYKKFRVWMPMMYESVTEKGKVILYTIPGKQTDGEILWRFGDKDTLIAEIKGGTGKTHDGPDGRFRGRLMLDEKTGNLTITNITAEHAGHYKLKIRSSEVNITMTHIVIVRVSGKSVTEEKRVNESAAVEMPLLNGENVNEQEGTSSL